MNASAHLVTLFDVGSHAPRGSSSESRHVIHVHVRLSLSSPLSSSTSICPSRPKLRDLSADQNYKGSLQKTNWRSRTSCRKFGDLIAADHKVLSENCESRNNHRYAVVVQDLATQWIQSYPCETKTSQEIQRSLQKFLEPERKPKVIYTDNSLEFGKACEDLPGIIVRQHLTVQRLMGLLKEQYAELKKGPLLCCCNQVWMKKWWADSMECYCYLRKILDLLGDLENLFKDQSFHLVRWLSITL